MRWFIVTSLLVSSLIFLGSSTALSFEFLEPSQDTMLVTQEFLSYFHVYGSRQGEIDLESVFPWFSHTFCLHVTNTVGQWDSTDVANFINTVMDSDSTNSDDVFPRVWSYFCYGDSNAAYDRVRFRVAGNDTTTYYAIDCYLYDRSDFPCSGCPPSYYCPPEICPDCPHQVCQPNNWYNPGTNDIFVNASAGAAAIDTIASVAFAHELQHLCNYANGRPEGFCYHYYGEALSMAAEHLVGGILLHNNTYDVSYDASISSFEDCDPNYKLMVWAVWMGYFMGIFRNEWDDDSDDLLYNWIRYEINGERPFDMEALAGLLEDQDPEYEWLGGATGDERLQNLVQYFLVAKFANARNFGEDGRFGFDGVYGPVEHAKLFLDVCHWRDEGATPDTIDCPLYLPGHQGCWNVRILPPSYTLYSTNENLLTTKSGIYQDGDDTPNPADGDSSRDYIDVATYGTDYIIFKAGDCFQDGVYHEFHFWLFGEEATPPPNSEVKMWVIGYDSAEDMLQLHPEDIVFIEPVSLDSDSTKADVVVTDFGRSIKSVVVAIALVETAASSDWIVLEYFTYGYQYGVYSPDSADVTWKGDVFVTGDIVTGSASSLTVQSGTNVRVAPTDYSHLGDSTQIEWNIYGDLNIIGTSARPVIIGSWAENPQAGDWAGIRACGSSGSASIAYCDISHAYHGIKSYRPVQLSHCNISNCEVHGVFVQGSGADGSEISYCTTTGNGSCGIIISDCDNVSVSHCTSSSGYDGIWLSYSGNSSVDHTMTKLNVSNGVMAVGSNCTFDWCTVEDNDQQGIYLSQSAGTISNTKIWKNTANGLYCVGASSNPGVDHSKIEQNAVGVRVSNNACPILGDDDLEVTQYNSIYNQPIYVFGSPNYTIMAENCWWGTGPGEMPSPTLFKGIVDYFPLLQYDPVPNLAPRAPKKPTALSLAQNYPNPSVGVGMTKIMYSIPRENEHERVSLTIYDVNGRRVKTLVDGVKMAGTYQVYWDGRTEKGRSVASGIYFYKLTVGTSSISKKLILYR